MKKPPSVFRRLIKKLASLRLAVFVIIALGTITAWGTFVEASYNDAVAAQKIVYHSVWMYSVMGTLTVNLIAVMIDRWPWQWRRHTGFVMAHIGLIVLMSGSVVTALYGIDGSISIGPGESSRHVQVSDTDLTVYSSLDGSRYTKVWDRPVDFWQRSPSRHPVEIPIPNGTIRVLDFYPYAFREQKIVEGKGQDGAAVRFQLQNANVNMAEWLFQPGQGREVAQDLGPAQVVLTGREFSNLASKNSIVLKPKPGTDEMDYEIHTIRTNSVRRGTAKAGDSIETGWMGLVFRVLKYLPQAKEEISFKPAEASTPLTVAAIKVDYNGTVQWMAANSLLKLFSDQAVYIVTYANRRIDLGFDMKLKDFRVGRYPGTLRAASYESLVEVPDAGEVLISMNEPLKLKGFTFYQASFSEDESGRILASILSVNWDPGRWIKYLGSLLIVLGTIHMFYFRRTAASKTKSDEMASAAKAG